MTDLSRPRVLVYGAGAVGSLLGGLLSNAGYDVTLLGRASAMDTVRRHGLSVELHDRTFGTHPQTASSIEDLDQPFDIVFLTVRTYAVEKALVSLPSLIADGGVLVSVQNGIGTEELIARTLQEVQHVAGSLTLSADLSEEGTVTSSSRSGGIALAPVSPEAPARLIGEMFRAASTPVSMFDDYRSMKWSKLLLNQMANGIPAILGWTPGQLYRHREAFQVEQAMLRETLRVISQDGSRLVYLPGFPVPLLRCVLQFPAPIARRLLLSRVEGGRGHKLPSMLLDLQAGRTKLESDWLYGAVADVGPRYGTAAPVNQRVNTILKGIATNPDLRQRFRNRPDLLIRNVRLAMENK